MYDMAEEWRFCVERRFANSIGIFFRSVWRNIFNA
jgi:hypothetical protein